jgi:excisionase family DNA binding protein
VELLRDGIRVAELEELVVTLDRVTTGQEGPSVDHAGDREHGRTMPALLLSLADTAAVLGGISESTVKRMIAAGDLPAVKLAGRTLVRAEDLEAVVASLPTSGGHRGALALKANA